MQLSLRIKAKVGCLLNNISGKKKKTERIIYSVDIRHIIRVISSPNKFLFFTNFPANEKARTVARLTPRWAIWRTRVTERRMHLPMFTISQVRGYKLFRISPSLIDKFNYARPAPGTCYS